MHRRLQIAALAVFGFGGTPGCRCNGGEDADAGVDAGSTEATATTDSSTGSNGDATSGTDESLGAETVTQDDGSDSEDDLGCVPEVDPLLWKRADALEADLMRALELGPDPGCIELGTTPCKAAHLVPLGGNDPFALSLYEPMPRPLATTGMAVERLALALCAQRAALDAQGEARVFGHIDLAAQTLAADDPGLGPQVSDLYRRLLARDPSDVETEIVRGLAAEPISGRDFAVAACFAIATTTEFMTF